MGLRRFTWLAASAALAVGFVAASGCGPQGSGNKPVGNAPGNAAGTAGTGGGAADGALLSAAEMETAKDIYFDRCAGCHGVLRKGATGPNIEPASTKPKGTEYLKKIINDGTDKGMPEWGKSGTLNAQDVDLMARYIQVDPPAPPEWSLKDMKSSHKVLVPVAQRPSAPPPGRNWQNYFGVILRDVGKVAIIDGDTKKVISIVKSGFAVHILRTSASGRYFYTIGRDGRVTLIDLWMEKPDTVAEVKAANDARSIDTSKFEGFEDKYAIVGGYWPPVMAVLKGDTLEPIRVISTSSYEIDEGTFVREARVAAIVSDHHHPTWVVNIKEAGQIWLVDYSKLGDGEGTVSIDQIRAERFLHDGGWDTSKRYFLVAANARNKVSIIDTQSQKLVKNLDTGGVKPHPGRGANLVHPQFGPLWATGHVGSNDVTFIGTDPDGHPDNAFKVVKKVQLPGDGGGNLFIKTHPNSQHIYCDRPLHPDVTLADSIFVLDKNSFEHKKTLTIPEQFRGHKAVHLEFNKDGNEIWVCAWGKKSGTGAILVYDDKTLELKATITDPELVTPTGHFNVWNTVKDIY
ncbi:MAG: c-type cytochrome [Planctomycetes bacterium]|nr:c-type cytochrome [Planctomycetota bacterium]